MNINELIEQIKELNIPTDFYGINNYGGDTSGRINIQKINELWRVFSCGDRNDLISSYWFKSEDKACTYFIDQILGDFRFFERKKVYDFVKKSLPHVDFNMTIFLEYVYGVNSRIINISFKNINIFLRLVDDDIQCYIAPDNKRYISIDCISDAIRRPYCNNARSLSEYTQYMLMYVNKNINDIHALCFDIFKK